MKIGVFDSGIGGLSLVHAIEKAMPQHEVVFMNDQQHVPYGSKTSEEIMEYVVPIFEALVARGCQAIVVACNTVSTALITELRQRFAVPLVAIEPMVKTAASLTQTGVIAICATPRTLATDRYAWLKHTYASSITVVEPDCSDWAYMIEHKQVDDQKIRTRIEQALDQNADVIVLGCTHYHWIETEIKQIAAGRAQVVQPEQAIVAQLTRVLAQLP
jgi:glutamate racemase